MSSSPRSEAEIVDHALLTRRSVRGFLPTQIARADLEAILHAAGRAPSGTNIQPWKVYVLTGAAKEGLSGKVLAAHEEDYARKKRGESPLHEANYFYYPRQWFEPYLARLTESDRQALQDGIAVMRRLMTIKEPSP